MPQLQTTEYLILFINLQTTPRGRDTFLNRCCKKNRHFPQKKSAEHAQYRTQTGASHGETVHPAERDAHRNRGNKNILAPMPSHAGAIKESSFTSRNKLYCPESSRPTMAYSTSDVKKYDTFPALTCAQGKTGSGRCSQENADIRQATTSPPTRCPAGDRK